MKRNYPVEIIAALLILLFVYTGASKLFDMKTFHFLLRYETVVGKMASVVVWILPLGEIAIALLLFFPRTRRIGLWASLFTMIIFTGYLCYMIYFTPTRPCSCGGVLRQMTWKQHFVFNIFFTLLAAIGLWLDKRKPSESQSRVTYSAVA